AYRVGLVNRVVPLANLREEARKVAEKILRNAPLSVRASKEAFLRGGRMPLREGIRMAKAISFKLQTSEDTREGLRAFREKREPRWQGR
ncbi:MAG: enoyl-CoA hydratase/isomerase family protein, partial [Nitrospinota bacterium]